MAKQNRLINEYRQSGMTDADWCRENDIAVSSFYNWVSRCRKVAAEKIPAPNCGHHAQPLLKQDAVPIDTVPDCFPEHMYLDNSHTIEVTIQISNDVDPTLIIRICLPVLRHTDECEWAAPLPLGERLGTIGTRSVKQHLPNESFTARSIAYV